MFKETIRWEMLGGTFQTNYKVQLNFKLPKFDGEKIITWDCYLDEDESEQD
jgi:hypothetical protein